MILDTNEFLFNTIAKAFQEAHLQGKVKFSVANKDDVGARFKNAVKDAFNAKFLDDADVIIGFSEPVAAVQEQPVEEQPPAEQPPAEQPAEQQPAEQPEGEPPAEEPAGEKPDEQPAPEPTPVEEQPAEEKPEEEKPEDGKKDDGEKDDKKKEKVNESLEKRKDPRALLRELIAMFERTAPIRADLIEVAEKYYGSLVSEADGDTASVNNTTTAAGADLKKKIIDNVKRALGLPAEENVELFDLDGYADGFNVSFAKLSLKGDKKDAVAESESEGCCDGDDDGCCARKKAKKPVPPQFKKKDDGKKGCCGKSQAPSKPKKAKVADLTGGLVKTIKAK